MLPASPLFIYLVTFIEDIFHLFGLSSEGEAARRGIELSQARPGYIDQVPAGEFKARGRTWAERLFTCV